MMRTRLPELDIPTTILSGTPPNSQPQNFIQLREKIKNANEKYRGSLYNSVHTWPFVFLIRKVSLLSHREGNPPTK